MNISSRALMPVRAALAALIVAGSVSLIAAPSALAKPKHQLKIATLAPDGSTWMNIMRDLDKAVQEETGGAVGLKFYPGGIQGDEPIVLRKIRSGQLHGGGFTGVGLGTIAPELRVLELPFLFQNDEEVRRVHEKLGPKFDAIVNEAGYTILGWADVGFVYLYSKSPIRTKADLSSQKVWLWEGDPLAEEFLSQAGVSPVPLSITDVMTSLQTGLISSVYVSPLGCIALQWFTRVGYTTDVPITHAMGAVVVSNRAWNKIPEEHRTTVKRLCDEHFAKLRVATIDENAQSRTVIAESGVETVVPPASEITSLREIGNEVATAMIGGLYSAELLAEVRATLKELRAETQTTP